MRNRIVSQRQQHLERPGSPPEGHHAGSPGTNQRIETYSLVHVRREYVFTVVEPLIHVVKVCDRKAGYLEFAAVQTTEKLSLGCPDSNTAPLAVVDAPQRRRLIRRGVPAVQEGT